MFQIENKNTHEMISQWKTYEEALEQLGLLDFQFNEIDSQFQIVEV